MGAKSHDKKGQSLVELGLLLPFLLWICMGIVDFARVYYYDNVAINAARSGARVAAVINTPADTIRAAAKADATGSKVQLSDSDIEISWIPSAHTKPAGGDTITVKVTYRFQPITPFIGRAIGGTFTVNRSASMMVLY